jgi:catechol 2,3-dioxygenase-like lactoylglutathione lyase family enzyme
MGRDQRRPAVQLDHVVLEVSDVQTSLAFYDRVFGLARVREREFLAGEAPFASVRVNRRTLIDLFPRSMWRGPAPSNPNHVCLTFSATDFRSLLRRLKSAQIKIVRTAKHNYGALEYADSIYVQDPGGVVVEARFYPTKSRRRRTRG